MLAGAAQRPRTGPGQGENRKRFLVQRRGQERSQFSLPPRMTLPTVHPTWTQLTVKRRRGLKSRPPESPPSPEPMHWCWRAPELEWCRSAGLVRSACGEASTFTSAAPLGLVDCRRGFATTGSLPPIRTGTSTICGLDVTCLRSGSPPIRRGVSTPGQKRWAGCLAQAPPCHASDRPTASATRTCSGSRRCRQ